MTPAAGDEIGIWTHGDIWIPFRFEAFDTLGNMRLRNVMRFQPPTTIWHPFHGVGKLGAWLFATDPRVTFRQTCPACSVRITNAEKAAAILHDDYGWVRGPKASKNCQMCRATRMIPWQPFAQQPVFAIMHEIAGL